MLTHICLALAVFFMVSTGILSGMFARKHEELGKSRKEVDESNRNLSALKNLVSSKDRAIAIHKKLSVRSLRTAEEALDCATTLTSCLKGMERVARTSVAALEESGERVAGLLAERKETETMQIAEEYKNFSRRTVIRSSYLQLTENPASMMLCIPVIAGLESLLQQHDGEWLDRVIGAFETANNGDTSEVSNLMKEVARDLHMLRLPREGELPN